MLLAAMTRVGGVDSLRALHVDHGLHPDSAAWTQRCRAVCREWDVPFASLRVIVDPASGTGIEAAARDARYRALGELLAEGETLLTAHHADDQLETLLLRLLRGTGVRGLRGILPEQRFATGSLVRPLLGLTRAEIRAMAERWQITWLEDPSNQSLDFDRNLVRTRILPIVHERWGDVAADSANRVAASMRDAEQILADAARQDLEACGADSDRLSLPPLRALDAPRRRNALRHAVREAGLPVPDARRLQALAEAVAASGRETVACIEWSGGQARFYRDRLYLLAPPPSAAGPAREPGPHPIEQNVAGRVDADTAWRGASGALVLEPADDDARVAVPESWARAGLEVRFRQGGERFKPAGDAHHRTLKGWFQQRGIVPWMRDRVPLLYYDDALVAIADLAIDERARVARPGEARWRIRWLAHPRIE